MREILLISSSQIQKSIVIFS